MSTIVSATIGAGAGAVVAQSIAVPTLRLTATAQELQASGARVALAFPRR